MREREREREREGGREGGRGREREREGGRVKKRKTGSKEEDNMPSREQAISIRVKSQLSLP